MKGLELSKLYFEEFGRPMLEESFPEYIDRIAVGFVGHGSECFGFDDEISRDHDFEPGFSLWITEEDERIFGFKLMRAYSKLPKEFMGIKIENKSLFGSDTKGVHTIREFYSFYLPQGKIPEKLSDWLKIPDFYLAEATNGAVFQDPLGEFTKIREAIKSCPEDVWLQKLASAVFCAAQSGQYNYERCLSHSEEIAAAAALMKYAENVTSAVFLLNREFMPYYKWAWKKMRELPLLSELCEKLRELLKEPYNKEKNLPLIEEIAALLASEIRRQGLSNREESYLEGYAYCIKNSIKDGNLRNSPIIV